jgi:hypothetical protein
MRFNSFWQLYPIPDPKACTSGRKERLSQPWFSELLRALVEELNPREQLRFGLLEWDGRPLAYHLGFQVKDKFTMYQQAFDVDAWDYSPREVLLRQLFLYAADHVTREFDFSVGCEFYKSRFANHLKKNFTLYMGRPSLLGRVGRFRRGVEGRLLKPTLELKSAVRTRPAIFRKVKYVRQWASELRSYRRLRNRRNELRLGPDGPARILGKKQLLNDGVSNQGSPSDIAHPAIQIIAARLSNLADLHLDCPTFRLATRFSLYKERLRRQDRAYIVRYHGQPLLLAWITTKQAPHAPSTPGNSINPGDNVLYDCKYLGKFQSRPPYEAVLTLLIESRIIEWPLEQVGMLPEGGDQRKNHHIVPGTGMAIGQYGTTAPSPREYEVIALVGAGFKNSEVGRKDGPPDRGSKKLSP